MHFHARWHRAPADIACGAAWNAPIGALRTVELSGAELFIPWDNSFEAAITALETLPGMFCEWDGAFVWRPARDRQVEGVLFDRDGRLAYLELKGNCTRDEAGRLAAALNPAGRLLIVQLPREGVFLTWSDWLRMLAPA